MQKKKIIVPFEHFSTVFVQFMRCKFLSSYANVMRLSHSVFYLSISFYRFVILCSGLERFFFSDKKKYQFEFSSSGIV